MPVVCSRVRYVRPAVAGSKRQVILRKIFFFSPAKIEECIFPPAKCVRRSYGKLLFHPWRKVWEINCRPDLSFGNSPLLHSQHLSICTPSHSSSIPPPKDSSNIFIPFYGKMLQGCSRAIINNGAKTKKDGSIRKNETRVLPPPLSPLGGDLKSLPHKVMRQESSSLPPFLPLLRGQRETKYPKIRPYPSSSFSLFPFPPAATAVFSQGRSKVPTDRRGGAREEKEGK